MNGMLPAVSRLTKFRAPREMTSASVLLWAKKKTLRTHWSGLHFIGDHRCIVFQPALIERWMSLPSHKSIPRVARRLLPWRDSLE